MEEVLTLIRQLAETLEDPPDLPSDLELHDQEQVDAAAESPPVTELPRDAEVNTTPSASVPQSEAVRAQSIPFQEAGTVERRPQPIVLQEADKTQPYFVRPLTPDTAPRQPVPVTEVSQAERFQLEQVSPHRPEPKQHPQTELVKTPPTPPPSAQTERRDVEGFPVLQAQQVTPVTPADQTPVSQDASVMSPAEPVSSPKSPPRPVETYDPARVVTAETTLQVAQARAFEHLEATSRQAVDSRQVNVNTRVVHAVPEDFPVDAMHAFTVIDRDVDLPALDVQGPSPVSLPGPSEEVSSEEMVSRKAAEDSMLFDQMQRGVLS